MADETPAAGTPQQTGATPTFNMLGQYGRELSFEYPNAPKSIMNGSAAPTFNVSINVGVKKQNEELYAVELTLNAKAEREDAVLFNVELIYGGVFRVRNVPEQQLAPLLMIECPRMIFPFARQVLASVTQQGGFPPLMMEPVDFAQIYRQSLQNLAQQQKAAGSAPASTGEKPN
jgi:preprotein translocase subunit SecB